MGSCLSVCLIIPGLPCVGTTWATYLLMTHCNYWLSLSPSWQHCCVRNPSLECVAFVIYAAAYPSTFLEMCCLLSACTREKPRLSESSEDHGSFRVCLGPVIWVRVKDLWETESILIPKTLTCWWRSFLSKDSVSFTFSTWPCNPLFLPCDIVKGNDELISSLCKWLIFVEGRGRRIQWLKLVHLFMHVCELRWVVS